MTAYKYTFQYKLLKVCRLQLLAYIIRYRSVTVCTFAVMNVQITADILLRLLSQTLILQVDDKAIRRFGSKEEDRGAGWLGAAASFLAKSFYW